MPDEQSEEGNNVGGTTSEASHGSSYETLGASSTSTVPPCGVGVRCPRLMASKILGHVQVVGVGTGAKRHDVPLLVGAFSCVPILNFPKKG